MGLRVVLSKATQYGPVRDSRSAGYDRRTHRWLGNHLCRFAGPASDAQAPIERGHEPKDGGDIGTFQILWIYYGVLIVSRPVVAWNVIGVLINFFSVGAYSYCLRKEKAQVASRADN